LGFLGLTNGLHLPADSVQVLLLLHLSSKEGAKAEKTPFSLSEARDVKTKTHFLLVIDVVHLISRMRSPVRERSHVRDV
jgi:hypothetical protein